MPLPNNTISAADVSNQLALDTKSLGNLKLSAKENSPEAIKGVAKQFEAIFINMMLKSMRDATPSDSLTDSQDLKLYTSMFDQQISQKLASGKGIGLADMLTKQLSKAAGITASNSLQTQKALSASTPVAFNPALDTSLQKVGHFIASIFGADSEDMSDLSTQVLSAAKSKQGVAAYQKTSNATNTDSTWLDKVGKLKDEVMSSADDAVTTISASLKDSATQFLDKFSSHAQEASQATGMPANYMLGQAALETGWGKKEIIAADGSQSFNLFGIKANSGWRGKVVDATTTEYIDGIPQKMVQKFRAYDSYADSFKDFAKMISSSPKFKAVMNNISAPSSYANAMAKSGYATDPGYASKLHKLIKIVGALK
jgi:flagellar protein FlgJ